MSCANMDINQNQSLSVILGFESLKQGKEASNRKEKSDGIDEGADKVSVALGLVLERVRCEKKSKAN